MNKWYMLCWADGLIGVNLSNEVDGAIVFGCSDDPRSIVDFIGMYAHKGTGSKYYVPDLQSLDDKDVAYRHLILWLQMCRRKKPTNITIFGV